MRVGPSGPDCRIGTQTTGCCAAPRGWVVSETGKGGQTRQVSARKTNESEPLMTCRKRSNVLETGFCSLARDEALGEPVDCQSGVRHEGGVSLAQALLRNVGTLVTMRRESSEWLPHEDRVPKRAEGTDGLVVAMKPGNAGGAKGPDDLANDVSQPEMGRAHG